MKDLTPLLHAMPNKSVDTYKVRYLNAVKQTIRWMKGQRFPQGFDEWCQQSEPPAGRTNFNFVEFERSERVGSPEEKVKKFIDSVIRSRRCLNLSIHSPNSSFGEWDIPFPPVQHSQHNPAYKDMMNVWKFTVSGHYKSLQIGGLTVWDLNLQPDVCEKPIRLNDCTVGILNLRDGSNLSHKLNLELHNCWIGTLVLPQACVKGLSITGGGLANIDCPSADGSNPFKGAVTFNNVFFPTSSRHSSLFAGPQAYRSLHAHLKKHDNMLMANMMRACQLRSERSSEHGFAKSTNWIYGTFANYGTSPGRPLWWLFGIYILAFAYIYTYDQGVLAQLPDFYKGSDASLLDENGGRFNRSWRLPLQSIVSPFGIFFDARKIILPSTNLGSLLLTVQGLCSDMLLLMAALGVRRRFKVE